MAKVLCTLPNASEEISGVKFEQREDGMLSEDISDEQAAAFVEIPGYALMIEPDQGPSAEMIALTAKAVELGIEINPRWAAKRLTAEIEKAESEKANADASAADAATPAA